MHTCIVTVGIVVPIACVWFNPIELGREKHKSELP
jgi:hypothetical protein